MKDRNRIWIVGAALVIGIVAALGWLLGISPQLDAARAATLERTAVEAQNAAYEAQLNTLTRDFADIAARRSELSALRRMVPPDADVAGFVKQFSSLAEQTSTTVSSFTVGDPVPYDPTLVAPVEPAAEPAADPVPAGPVAPVVPPSAVSDLITAGNFVTVPVAFSLSGTPAAIMDFVAGQQTGDRLMSVQTLTTDSGADPDTVTASLTGLVFVLLVGTGP